VGKSGLGRESQIEGKSSASLRFSQGCGFGKEGALKRRGKAAGVEPDR